MRHDISIVVPAYNEAKNIHHSLLFIKKAVSKRIRNYEIIVVDDGSTDSTFDEAQKAGKDIRIISYRPNYGKGNALKQGYFASKGKIVVFLDADLEIPPESIFKLLDEIKKGYDIVMFSKNNKSSKINFPLYRKMLSKMYYIFVKTLFRLPISDTQTGCKAFKKEVLSNVLPYVYTKEFAFDLELLAYANDYGYTLKELPLEINFKRDKGRIKFKNVCKMAIDTLIIFYRFYIKKIHRWPADKL